MPTPIIQTESLTKEYAGFRALDALNLRIEPGEVYGLLGPNGSGKSTAIRLMLGFLRPTSGRARINGYDCWNDSVSARRQMTYLPGELRLYESMTGRHIVRFLAELRGDVFTSEVDVLARRLDIDIDRPLTQMSSGMKRKVALLTVLLPRVPLIILDEPTNTLDPTMRDELLDQLLLAKQRGQAVLFSSHVLSEVERVCDRVGILRRGVLVHQQSMSELRDGRHVRALLRKLPRLGPNGEPLAPTELNAAGDLRLDYRGPVPSLLRWLEQCDPQDLHIEPMGLTPIYHRFHGSDTR